MDNDQIIIKIHAFLSGQMSEQERVGFQSWLEEREENMSLYKEVKDAWDIAALYNSPGFDIETARKAMPFALDEQVSGASRKSNSMLRWSIAASLLVIVVATYWLTTTGAKMLTTTADQAEQLQLSDGSMIFLHDDGILQYPEEFGTRARKVELDGEAYFDIAHDESRKFIIETEFASITVLGTEFGVDVRDDGVVEVHVSEGKVRVDPNDSEVYIDLVAGQSAYYDSQTGELRRVRTSDLNEIAWHTHKLSFNDARLTEVVNVLEETYDVNIDVENTALGKCLLNSNYSNTPLETILTDMSQIWGCKVVQDGSTYKLIGGSCN